MNGGAVSNLLTASITANNSNCQMKQNWMKETLQKVSFIFTTDLIHKIDMYVRRYVIDIRKHNNRRFRFLLLLFRKKTLSHRGAASVDKEIIKNEKRREISFVFSYRFYI